MKIKTLKVFVLLVAVAIIFATLPLCATFVSATTEDLFSYEIYDNEACITRSLNQDVTTIEIPETIGGYPVVSLDSFAFSDCAKLESITIPNTVTMIGAFAFRDCIGLTSVTIPNSVTFIGYAAFSGCTNLKTITIPSSMSDIGSNTFSDCIRLTIVEIPDSVITIGESAFANCTELKDIYYTGTEQQKASIEIETEYGYNDYLLNATWHYESKLTEEIKPSEPTSDKQPKPGVVDVEDAKVDYKTDNGIKISDNKAFANGTVVTTKRLTNGNIFEKATTAMQGISIKYQVFEFDATLDGAAVQPNGKVTVTFDLPEGYAADKLGMFYVKDGKIAEQIKINVDKTNKTITAELEHFSTYVLAELTSSKTWDYGSSDDLNKKNYGIYVLFAGLLATAFTVIYANKKIYNR